MVNPWKKNIWFHLKFHFSSPFDRVKINDVLNTDMIIGSLSISTDSYFFRMPNHGIWATLSLWDPEMLQVCAEILRAQSTSSMVDTVHSESHGSWRTSLTYPLELLPLPSEAPWKQLGLGTESPPSPKGSPDPLPCWQNFHFYASPCLTLSHVLGNRSESNIRGYLFCLLPLNALGELIPCERGRRC